MSYNTQQPRERLRPFIRAATRADISVLAEIETLVVPDFPLTEHLMRRLDEYPNELARLNVMSHREFLVDPELFVIVAVDPGSNKPIGYALWRMKNKLSPPSEWVEKRCRRWWAYVESMLVWAEAQYHTYALDHISNVAITNTWGSIVDKAFGKYAHVPHLYLRHLFIAPEAQGKGVGEALLRYGFDAAEAAGVPVMLVCATAKAQTFYDKQGFRALGDVVLGEGQANENRMPAMIWEPASRR